MMAGAHEVKADREQRLSMLGRVLSYVKRSLANIGHWFIQTIREMIIRFRYRGYSYPQAFNKAVEDGNINAIRYFSKFADFDNRNGNTLLHRATQYRYSENLVKALANEQTVNQQNDLGETPLHIAARNRHAGAVKSLVKAGAKVDQQDNYGQTALHLAVITEDIEVVQILVEQRAKTDLRDNKYRTPLDWANFLVVSQYSHQRANIAYYLTSLQKGPDPSSSAVKDKTEVVQEVNPPESEVRVEQPDNKGRLCWPNSSDEIPVELANYLGLLTEPEQSEHLQRASKRLDESNTALHWAVVCDDLPSVQELASIQPVMINKTNCAKQTPLYIATRYGYREIMKLLVKEFMADVNQSDYSEDTPLHEAVLTGNLPTVQVLVEELGACVNQKNTFGDTPLDRAKRLLATSTLEDRERWEPIVNYLDQAVKDQAEVKEDIVIQANDSYIPSRSAEHQERSELLTLHQKMAEEAKQKNNNATPGKMTP